MECNDIMLQLQPILKEGTGTMTNYVAMTMTNNTMQYTAVTMIADKNCCCNYIPIPPNDA